LKSKKGDAMNAKYYMLILLSFFAQQSMQGFYFGDVYAQEMEAKPLPYDNDEIGLAVEPQDDTIIGLEESTIIKAKPLPYNESEVKLAVEPEEDDTFFALEDNVNNNNDLY
jgi:hypothetical protein